MTSPAQTYATHRRWLPLYHFVVQPILVANVAVSFWRLGTDPSFDRAWIALVAVALEALSLSARHMAIVNQNRIIRSEERLRLKEILPADLRGRIDELRVPQLVALRFAADAEVPSLVQSCLAGDLRTGDEIKRQIVKWRPDTLRV